MLCGNRLFCLQHTAGNVQCHNISEEYRDCADQTGCGSGGSAWGRSWDIEACRQSLGTCEHVLALLFLKHFPAEISRAEFR